MLSDLEQYQRDLQNNLESTRTSSDQLARAISQAVMTLQFQDAVSQRLKHVTETMGDIRDSFGTLVTDTAAAEKRSAEWMEKLESSYCVDDERLVMSGESAADLGQSHSSDIELF